MTTHALRHDARSPPSALKPSRPNALPPPRPSACAAGQAQQNVEGATGKADNPPLRCKAPPPALRMERQEAPADKPGAASADLQQGNVTHSPDDEKALTTAKSLSEVKFASDL